MFLISYDRIMAFTQGLLAAQDCMWHINVHSLVYCILHFVNVICWAGEKRKALFCPFCYVWTSMTVTENLALISTNNNLHFN